MANDEHLEVLKQGVEVWNRWRRENPNIEPDLYGAQFHEINLCRADLSGANLNEVIFFEANLGGANLSGANLNWADLTRANLTKANLGWGRLIEADLSRANLGKANLNNADLSGANPSKTNFGMADLVWANFSGANFSGADLSETILGYTVFGDIDLRGVKRLETVKHLGPSTIGIDTIYKSQGQIPEVFLRGAAVQNDFITYIQKVNIPKCPYMLEQLDNWINNGQNLLLTVSNRLAHYQNQAAALGPLQVPYHVISEIDSAKAELDKITSQIAEWQRLKDLYY